MSHLNSCTKDNCTRRRAELRGEPPAAPWAENHRQHIPSGDHMAPRELEQKVDLLLRKRQP